MPACQTNSDALERSEFFAKRHKFHQAYWVIVEAKQDNPDDPELERVFWERRLDYLLANGRDLVYHERELEAIAEFQKVLALDPENAEAKRWIRRSKQKLAVESIRLAEGLRHEGDLEAALKLYNQAARYVPELEDAMKGIEEVNKKFLRRAERGGEHYVLGSRARGEQKYRQSHYQSGLATYYDETLTKAKELKSLSGKRLARGLFARAEKMEEGGFYSAALQEYMLVQSELPDTPGLAERIAAMKNEVDVRDKCREAEMLLRQEEFDKADALLVEAFELSRVEKARVSTLMRDAKMLRYEVDYNKAKDLELEHRYEAALAAFKVIDKEFGEEGFLDVKARVSGLTSQIDEANKSYKAGIEAEKAGKLKDAINHFEDAILVYPGFKNLQPRIDALRIRAGVNN